MTLTFLDLYNTAASQEWSMYDGNAVQTNDFEKAFVIDLNKAVTEVLYSFPFSFRKRVHILFTIPKIKSYPAPKGQILYDFLDGNYHIKINSRPLKHIKDTFSIKEKIGIPDSFYLYGSNLILYPTPSEKFIVTVEYLSLAIGENNRQEDIFTLENYDDILSVPEHLEEIFKQAVIAKTMLNSISSESDENYSAYLKQYHKAFRQLVKYSKGVGYKKNIKI